MLIVLLMLENLLVFPASKAADWWVPPPADCTGEDVWLTTADKTPIHAWWAQPDYWDPGQGALLFCHGNGGNLSLRCESARYWVREHRTAVLLFDYPGYGKSGGRPSEAGCYASAEAAYDWLVTQRQVPAHRLLLYGGSLGGAVAVDLASRLPHRALILVSTFTSLPDMAQSQFPYFPARWLVSNRFDSLTKIPCVSGPVFVTHGTADELVPFTMGQKLFAAAREPKEFFAMRGQRHTDAGNPAAFRAFAEFLQKHAPPS